MEIVHFISAFQHVLKNTLKEIYSCQQSTALTDQLQASYSWLLDFNHSYPLFLFPPQSAASIYLVVQMMIRVISHHTGKRAPVPTTFPADTALQTVNRAPAPVALNL